MTFDKVTPLNRRTNGKFRDYPNNMNYPRPNQAYEPPWIRSQRWMATTPAAIGRGSNERDGYSRLTKISIFFFLNTAFLVFSVINVLLLLFQACTLFIMSSFNLDPPRLFPRPSLALSPPKIFFPLFYFVLRVASLPI